MNALYETEKTFGKVIYVLKDMHLNFATFSSFSLLNQWSQIPIGAMC